MKLFENDQNLLLVSNYGLRGMYVLPCVHYFLEGLSDLKPVPWGKRTPGSGKIITGMLEMTKGINCDSRFESDSPEIPRPQYPDSLYWFSLVSILPPSYSLGRLSPQGGNKPQSSLPIRLGAWGFRCPVSGPVEILPYSSTLGNWLQGSFICSREKWNQLGIEWEDLDSGDSKLVVVIHACKPRILEAETGVICEFKANMVHTTSSRPVITT